MKSEIIYEVSGLSYAYLDRFIALNGINLKVSHSEKIALLGANGSGKSTLLLVLAGLVFSQTGSVRFMGEELREEKFNEPTFRKFFRTRVGIVFQNSDIQLFNSNVEDEVLFGLAQLALSKDETDRRLQNYMELMGIAHLKDRNPQNLSIGEKKRVAIASVLAMEPQVILLDEPTSGLDPRTSRHLIEAISAFGQRGCTVITATQDIHIVPEISERVVILSEDKTVAQDGDVNIVLHDRIFLERHNLVHEHVHSHEGKTHVHPHEHPGHEHPYPHCI